MSTEQERAVSCPIKGHSHTLEYVREHLQVGTGSVLVVWGCPTGRYRWNLVDRRLPSAFNRVDRPRWGWVD